MQIHFWLRKNDATDQTGKCSVYCTITVNSVACVPFSTGIRVVADKWNAKLKSTDDEFHDTIRQELNRVENNIRKIKTNFEDAGKTLTATLIKATYLTIKKKALKKVVKKPKKTFLHYLKTYIATLRNEGISKNTDKNYLVRYNNIFRFIQQKRKVTILPNAIDNDFVKDLQTFYKKEFSVNHVNTHLGLIRRTLDFAVLDKALKYNILASMHLKYDETLNPKGIGIDEITKLENADGLCDFEQKCVDAFLFLCGSGMDYCDYLKLKPEHIKTINGKTLLRYDRQKTHRYDKVKFETANPILKAPALRIIEKYGGVENLPKVANLQNVNDNVQIVAKRLGINQHLTTKKGRKTFTNISQNIDRHTDEQTAYQLGHTTTKQLKKYREYDDNILADLLN